MPSSVQRNTFTQINKIASSFYQASTSNNCSCARHKFKTVVMRWNVHIYSVVPDAKITVRVFHSPTYYCVPLDFEGFDVLKAIFFSYLTDGVVFAPRTCSYFSDCILTGEIFPLCHWQRRNPFTFVGVVKFIFSDHKFTHSVREAEF